MMSEEAIVRYCSPTLAGLKTGNLFSADFTDAEAMRNTMRQWNGKLANKGVRFVPLRYSGSRALIYVYRPSMLSRDLSCKEARLMLERLGYSTCSPLLCIAGLIRRLKENADFPHEIGLFLGYPPEDVRGFMENVPGSCKCTGCWKVYGDADAAVKLFTKYKKCTKIYLEQWERGRTVERLTIACEAL